VLTSPPDGRVKLGPYVAGCDFNTRRVDFVALPLDTEADPRWVTYLLNDLSGLPNDLRAFGAARSVATRVSFPWRWDDLNALFIERPISRGRKTQAALMRVQGAIIARLPTPVRNLTWETEPSEWQKTFLGEAMGGPAGRKQRVMDRAAELGFTADYDGCDAYGIAWAMRHKLWREAGR